MTREIIWQIWIQLISPLLGWMGWIGLYLGIGLAVRYVQRWTSTDSTNDAWWIVIWPLVLSIWLVLLIVAVITLLYSRLEQSALTPFSILDRFLATILRRRVHSDETGELWRSPNPYEIVQWVRVVDKTGEHWIRVPPTISTAKEGVAWTYRMDVWEYNPTIRT